MELILIQCYFKPVIKGFDTNKLTYKFKNFQNYNPIPVSCSWWNVQVITTGDYDAFSWSQTATGSTSLNNFIISREPRY